MAESLTGPEVRQGLIRQYLAEADVSDARTRESLAEYFDALPDKEMVSAMMAGVRKSQLRTGQARLGDYVSATEDGYPFAVDPLPNLYFTRDPFATIGTGVSIHRMHTVTRNRETLFGKFIFEHHPVYRHAPRWYDRGDLLWRGGDILVLSPRCWRWASPSGRRRTPSTPRRETVLTQSKTFRKLLAFNIPKSRSFMHLDTVFTMVDYDKFTVHPNILQQITVFVMELDENHKMKIRQEDGRLEDILKEHLELDHVTLIPCGQGQ